MQKGRPIQGAPTATGDRTGNHLPATQNPHPTKALTQHKAKTQGGSKEA